MVQGPLQMTPFFSTCTFLGLLMKIILSFLKCYSLGFHDTVTCPDPVLPLPLLYLIHNLISQMCIPQFNIWPSGFLHVYSFKLISLQMLSKCP